MWTDFLGAAETGRPPELTLEQLFADFAYLDAAYRSKASGRPETPKQPACRLSDRGPVRSGRAFQSGP